MRPLIIALILVLIAEAVCVASISMIEVGKKKVAVESTSSLPGFELAFFTVSIDPHASWDDTHELELNDETTVLRIDADASPDGPALAAALRKRRGAHLLIDGALVFATHDAPTTGDALVLKLSAPRSPLASGAVMASSAIGAVQLFGKRAALQARDAAQASALCDANVTRLLLPASDGSRAPPTRIAIGVLLIGGL
jgi:hypothetical protein